jgi:hypothetical protein
MLGYIFAQGREHCTDWLAPLAVQTVNRDIKWSAFC